MKKAVVTFNFGEHDFVDEPKVHDDSWDYFCFTDKPFDSNVWRCVPTYPFLLCDKRQASVIKISPFRFLLSRVNTIYDIVVTMDANLTLTKTPEYLLRYIKNNSFATIKNNNNLPTEISNISKFKKDDEKSVNDTIHQLKSKYGNPKKLAITSIIIRKNVDVVNEFDDLWLQMYLNGKSVRDQLSYPFALHTLKLKTKFIEWSELSQFCIMKPHNSK